MPSPGNSLWGNALAPPAERTPYMILKEQAAFVTDATSGVVEGQVSLTQDGERVEHELLLFAPVLQLRAPVVRITRGANAYPATVSSRFTTGVQMCDSEAELITALGQLLGSPPVAEALRTMKADSEASGLSYYLIEDGEVVGEAGTLEAARSLGRRLIRPDGLIDIHQLAKGRVACWRWGDPDGDPVWEVVAAGAGRAPATAAPAASPQATP